jgi:hypothetical protein
VHFDTGVAASALMGLPEVLDAARRAKEAGATRFCMGAAWRGPKDRDVEKVATLVAGVKALGLETCATLGLLDDGHAETLRDAGLDYYNHPGRRQFHLLRREAAHHRQPRRAGRPGAARSAGDVGGMSAHGRSEALIPERAARGDFQ